MVYVPVQPGSILADRYRIDRALGAGSMGVVVAAWHLELDQPVAIKFLRPGSIDMREAAERFRREVRAAAKIKSEHVARVLDVGTLTDGLPYMVMELLEGSSLEDELQRRGTIPVPEAVGYVLQAIEAIAEAHAAGVVHRDLKPANLFVARRADRSRLLKVLDFGISKSIGDTAASTEVRLTRTGMIVGSPLYMSPEQLRSTKTVDVRTDIWALGAILFQLVSGHTPYDAESVADLYAKLLRDAPASLSLYRSDLPPGFEAVVMRCLERDAENRFGDISLLAEALAPFATPSALVHVERARRVVESSRGHTPLSMQPPMLETMREAGAAGALPPAPSQSAQAAQSAPLERTGGKTARAWGAEAPAEKRQRVYWVSLAIAGVVAIAAFGAFRMLSPAGAAPDAAASALTSVPTHAAAIPVAPPVAAAPVSAAPAAESPPPAPSSAATASDAPHAAIATSAPSAIAPAKPAAPSSVAAERKPVAAAPVVPKVPAKTSAAASASVSNSAADADSLLRKFGGRK